MKLFKYLYAFLVLFLVLACVSEPKEDSYMNNEINRLKTQLDACSEELETLKNNPGKLWLDYNRVSDSLVLAKEVLLEISNRFPNSEHSEKANKKLNELNAAIIKEQEEKERLLSLGFSVLNIHKNFKYKELSYKIEKVSSQKRWSFDSYDDSYMYRDAKRGSKHIVVRLSVSSEINEPKLLPISIYINMGGKLKYLGDLEYKFRRWKDYGAYLGNYADYRNDFSHTKTIPFNCGIQLSSDLFGKDKLFVLASKKNCVNRNKDSFSRPEVSYTAKDCNMDLELTVEEAKENYFLIKKF